LYYLDIIWYLLHQGEKLTVRWNTHCELRRIQDITVLYSYTEYIP